MFMVHTLYERDKKKTLPYISPVSFYHILINKIMRYVLYYVGVG
jgi:hypothetical protein